MKRFSLAVLTLFVCAGAQAASTEVKMNLVTAEGTGQSVGTVNISETDAELGQYRNTSYRTLIRASDEVKQQAGQQGCCEQPEMAERRPPGIGRFNP